MDQELDDIEQQFHVPSQRERLSLLALTATVIGGASLFLMMLGDSALNNGDQRGWWMIGFSFLLPEFTVFFFLRFISLFDGPIPRRWALPDTPLAPAVCALGAALFLYTHWQSSELIPPWSIPVPQNLNSISGVLAETISICHGRGNCGSVGQIKLGNGELFQFTCSPGQIAIDCIDPDSYQSWTSKPVVVRYFHAANYRQGPESVVVEVKSPSGEGSLVTYDQRKPQLTSDLVHYRNEAAHPNFIHIWMTLACLGIVETSVFRRVPDPDYQY